MKKIIVPSIDAMIEINKLLDGGVMNRGTLEYLVTKIESKC